MKRIISTFLCVAMLMSMVAMTVCAYGAYEDQITTENVMTFTTDKDSYNPGETVTITVAMESIWGDPTIEDDIYGYDGDVMPGAYGMNILCAALIYDTSVFTAKTHKSLLATSTIKNADAAEASVSGNNPIEAKANGAYYLMAESDLYNADYDGYGFFTGSGDLWQYKLEIAADAAPGTYYLPVGPYRITDGQTEGSAPVIKFADEGLNDRLWAWNGNVDSLLFDRAVEYKTGYTGPSRVAEDSPMGAERECSYVVINIAGETPIDPPTPPVEEDPMSFELTVDSESYVAGDTVTATFSVKNNEGISDVSADVSFNNTALKLVDVSSPLTGGTSANVDYNVANKLGKFEDLAKPTEVYSHFDTKVSYEDDGAILTVKFEVLPTAEDGSSAITVTNTESGLDATADVIINAGGHKHDFKDVIVDPTCETKGTENKTCECGLDYQISVTPAKGHTSDENSKTATTPATCDKPGVIVTYCDVCGKAANNKEIAPLGHDLETVKTPLTCTSDETETQVCKREGCGYKGETIIINEKLGHKKDGVEMWGEPYISTRPTTSSIGYWGKDCALCGTTYEYEIIDILPIMHGDCNMDGKINLNDVSVLLKYIAKWEGLYFSKENADVWIELDATTGKQQFRINLTDATRILKYVAKWDVELGVPATRT